MGDKFDIWRRHFEKQARGLIPHDNTFYKVQTAPQNNQQEIFGKKIQIGPPTQQAIERAKSSLYNPPTIYDPVLGIEHHFTRKPRSVRTSIRKVKPKSKSKSKSKSKHKNNSKSKTKSKKK